MNNIKILFLLLLFIGILMIVIALIKSNSQFPQSPIQTIYKYLPKTMEEELNNPVYVSQIFNQMFTQPSPWIVQVNDLNYRKINDQANLYNISQV